MDIAREYLSKVEKQVLEKEEKLKKLEIILKKGFHYPIVSLTELIVVNDEKIKPAEYPEKEFTVLGVSNQTGVFINEKLKGEAIKQAYFKVHKNQFCYNPYRINVGSIGLCEFDFENQIISGAYNVFGCKESELNPKYLEALFKTKRFLDYVNQKASGGVRMDFKIEYLQEWQIPLPPLEVQNKIVAKIEKQKAITVAIQQLENKYDVIFEYEQDTSFKPIAEAVVDTKNGWSPKCEGGTIPVLSLSCLNNGKIDFSQVKFTSETIDNISDYYVKKRDFFYSRGNTRELVAKAAIAKESADVVFSDLLTRVYFNKDLIIPEYAVYLFNSQVGRDYFGKTPQGASASMVKVSQDYMKAFPIPYLGDIKKQQEIVVKLEKEMEALEGVRLLRQESEMRIEKIITEVWGEEN